MATLSTYTTRLEELLSQAAAELGDDDCYDNAVTAAIAEYSRYFPQIRGEDYDGDGSTYTFTLPSAFQETSRIVAIEYPQGEQDPDWLDSYYYGIYLDLEDGAVVRKLRLTETPADGNTVRMFYTCPHTITDSASTVPDSDLEPFCQLAAYNLASMIASFYGFQSKSTLEANLINYRSKADQWRSIANHFLVSFKLLKGMGPKDIVPAAASRGALIRYDAIFRSR